jgi:hypothetical protein
MVRICIINNLNKINIVINYVLKIPPDNKRNYVRDIFLELNFDFASLYSLVNETNLVLNLFSAYFVKFIYNLHMFQTSPGPSSEGTSVGQPKPYTS